MVLVRFHNMPSQSTLSAPSDLHTSHLASSLADTKGSSCSAEATPTAVDDENSSNPTASASLATPTTTAISSASSSASVPGITTDEFDLSTLPTGWANSGGSSHDLTAVILPLSLVLAGSIVALILACVVWRRKRRKEEKDVEKVLQRKVRGLDEKSDDGSENSSIQQAKSAQRKWAKAASRWKANIRHSARRRRTNRSIPATLVQDNQSSPSLPSSPFRNDDSVSVLRSPSSISSRHSHDNPPNPPPPPPVPLPRPRSSIDVSSVIPHAEDTPPIPSNTDSPLRPPAYHPSRNHPHIVMDIPSLTDVTPSYHAEASNVTASSSKLPLEPPPVDSSGDDEAVHGSPGHVATDDKATLARRAAMASAPPDQATRASLHHPPRAPELEDDDEIPADVLALSSAPSSDPIPPYPSLHPDLPPPPSLGKMAASRYEQQYAFSLEQAADVVGVEPEIGPSAPPFEEAQSEAGTATIVVIPSAPPVDEEGMYEDGDLSLSPSAPPLWDADAEASLGTEGVGLSTSVGVGAGVDVEVNVGGDEGLAGEGDAGSLRRTPSSVRASRAQSPGPGPSSAPSLHPPPVY